MKTVRITKANGQVGELTLQADGRYDITLNGTKAPGNNYYTADQVAKIIESAKAAGSKIEITE